MQNTHQSPPDTRTAMAECFYTNAIECNVDPAVGFIMQIPSVMQNECTPHMRVKEFCDSKQIEIDPNFFSDLHKLITTNGIQKVTPQAYVVSLKKAKTLEMYVKVRGEWGVHIPFFFQTCPCSAFYIYRTSADALHAMCQILDEHRAYYTKKIDGSILSLKVHWILEHIVWNNPCYALFDLDDYPQRFQGRISDDDIVKLMVERFPRTFTTLLIESGCLGDNEEILVEDKVKNRSRFLEEKQTQKSSFHHILSLFAPKTAHRKGVEACLQLPYNDQVSYADWLKAMKKAAETSGDYSAVPLEDFTSERCPASLISFDLAAPPGGPNGITTFFSKKNPTDPAPIYSITTELCLGLPMDSHICPHLPPHDIRSPHLSLQTKLQMLFEMSFTIPKPYMTFYTDEHIIQSQQAAADASAKVRIQFSHILL